MYLPLFIEVNEENGVVKLVVRPDARGIESTVYINGQEAQSITITKSATVHVVGIQKDTVDGEFNNQQLNG